MTSCPKCEAGGFHEIIYTGGFGHCNQCGCDFTLWQQEIIDAQRKIIDELAKSQRPLVDLNGLSISVEPTMRKGFNVWFKNG